MTCASAWQIWRCRWWGRGAALRRRFRRRLSALHCHFRAPSRNPRLRAGDDRGMKRYRQPTHLLRPEPLRRHEGDRVVLKHRTGEPAAATGAGIEADAVGFDGRRRARGMAVHDDRTKILFAREEALANAEQIILGLSIEPNV